MVLEGNGGRVYDEGAIMLKSGRTVSFGRPSGQAERVRRELEEEEEGRLREARLRDALRRLMKESAAIMALAEPTLREVVGHTNIAVFRLRITEAGELLDTLCPENSGQPDRS